MSSVKIDLKRELSELYAPGDEPSLVDVPDLMYLMIDGHGDPSTGDGFSAAIEALFSVAYAAKFALKFSGGGDIVVMPLEALWWTADMAHFAEDKSAWDWTAMIVQPAEMTSAVIESARQRVASKKSLPALELLRLDRLGEGQAAQVMHRGPYADEGPTVARLHRFIAEQGFRPSGKHHEIYLSDPKRTAPEKMRTVVRQPIVPL